MSSQAQPVDGVVIVADDDSELVQEAAHMAVLDVLNCF